jgi:hypothetical protein
MRINEFVLTVFAVAGTSSAFLVRPVGTATRIVHTVDTVFVRTPPVPRTASVKIDYDEITARVLAKLADRQSPPTVIAGDLIVKGRLGVRGVPEPATDHAVTIHGPGTADILFVANEALLDPQRATTQHRHIGTVGVAQDGGLRLTQNSMCYPGARGCEAEDARRRLAHSGFDSMGDWSFYLSNVDSLTRQPTAPSAQSLVFRLLDWDGNIHIASHRPGQKMYFNGSTKLLASDLVWEVPLH